MNTFIKALLVGLFLVHSAQAVAASRVLNGEEKYILMEALSLSPNNSFKCSWTNEHGQTGNKEYVLKTALKYVYHYEGSFTQYDSPTPLTQFVGRSGVDGYQLSLYTNPSYTEVTQIVMRFFQQRRVNKGNLAKPNVVKQDVTTSTWNCKKIESNTSSR